ncbi:MAG: hypothetical protein O7A06_08700 [Acidobacteria bacterium]|nr:hypothetical protein [Acidobacteriota bacterium]MCZ6752687.1 hypothetical protein [Acidobacteriota bacterium]
MQKRTRILSFLLFACGVFSGLLLTHSQANAQNGIPEGYVAKNMQAVGYLEMEPPFKLAIQEVEGRWYLYTGHLWAHGWSIIDVTEPTAPKLLKFVEGPENTWTIQMEVEDGKMITALQNQAERWGGNPAQPFEEGFLTWDLSDPANPKRLSHYRTGGTGVHRLGYYGGPYVHISARGLQDYRSGIYEIVDWEKNAVVGRWWVPGQREGEPPESANLHGPSYVVGNLAYLPFGGAGMVILDISDVSQPKLVSRLDFSPPFNDNITVHSVLPLPERELAVVTSEAIRPGCDEALNHASIVEIADPAKPRLLSLFPLPVPPPGSPYGDFCEKGGRFGPHNLNYHRHSRFVENNETRVYVTYFNAGLRVYDISNPRIPREVAYFIPPNPVKRYGPQPADTLVLQTEDVLVDKRGFIYISNKNQGLWILRLSGG